MWRGLLRRARRGVGEELLDEPALALVGHRLPDEPSRRLQREVGDLAAELGQGALLLRGDLVGGADAHPLELLARCRDVGVARLLGNLLGARQDVVRLATRLGEGRQALLLRGLAVVLRLLGVAQALLDALAAGGEEAAYLLAEGEVQDHREDDEV